MLLSTAEISRSAKINVYRFFYVHARIFYLHAVSTKTLIPCLVFAFWCSLLLWNNERKFEKKIIILRSSQTSFSSEISNFYKMLSLNCYLQLFTIIGSNFTYFQVFHVYVYYGLMLLLINIIIMGNVLDNPENQS